MVSNELITLLVVLLPLVGAIISGFFRNQIGRIGAHSVTIALVGLSFLLSVYLGYQYFVAGAATVDSNLYDWAIGEPIFPYSFHIGFLVDPLTVLMLLVVTSVSFLVHIYSIGYMHDDDGYQRFFSYISLFTFMMLMLVTANNFLQLFFGWEGVGLVSYLLIGFWYEKESALEGSLKAFLVNRVGDFGFILGIGLLMAYCGTLNYHEIFAKIPMIVDSKIQLFSGVDWSLVTVICCLLFVGAMGKSAQVPLHVWLPESMEGPTPISALIHAATMVTAGVFMLARISPLLEFSQTASNVILIIGATGALFMGLLGIVMNDIKRVVAYSTLSQLGYMMVAMGVSAYSAGIFHLATHAAFKALLFLAAGSVIIGMHHEQDMQKMGGLWRKMPITYACFVIGSLALCAIPPFAGFFSKDTIIEAVSISNLPASKYAYVCVLVGAMVTALYSFRALILTFHGIPRMSQEEYEHVHESPWVVWLPLVLLAIPSVFLGYIMVMPMLFDKPSLLGNAITVLPQHNVIADLAHEIHSPGSMVMHAPMALSFWFTLAGIAIAYVCYAYRPVWSERIYKRFQLFYQILINKYGFDKFNDLIFVHGSKTLGNIFYTVGDQRIIDGIAVNGSASFIDNVAKRLRVIQTGYLYHYATVMVMTLLAVLCWLILG